jgi:SAM-dependent methyltransferase
MRGDHDVPELFRCLQCGGRLAAAADGASLDCDGCRASHPIVNRVPRFVPSDNYAASFGMQWTRHRLTQLDSYTGKPLSRDRLFVATQWPQRLDGQLILEAGSGAGRFTEVLITTGARIYSFDYSAAVEANVATNGHSDRLTVFQGDIFHIPVRPKTFDKVLCLGVLQHTPDPHRAFRSLAAQVRPGGQLVVDLYARRLTALVSWKYLLRPLTRRMERERLYRLVERAVDMLLPLSTALRHIAGRAGVRLLPIAEYSYLGLPPAIHREWAILDTFDMYSPEHDHPQTIATLSRWFEEAHFVDIWVGRGPNGIVGRGRCP